MHRDADGIRTPADLERTLGLGSAVALGLGSILGTGVFVSLGVATEVVGSAVVVAVVLAAGVATANGLSSAQLAAAHPVSGGTYEYAHRLVHPAVGFAAGWLFLAAKSASAATAALGCAGYALRWVGIESAPPARVGVGLMIVLGVTALIAGGMRRSNRANWIIVSTTVLTLVAFVAAGAASMDASRVAARLRPSALTGALREPGDLLHATALMFVAYTGYGRIATLGEEVRDPARTIPRAVIATLGLSMVLYVSVAATSLGVAGPEAFSASTRESAAPLEAVARTFEYPAVAALVALGAIVAMAGVLLNLVLGLSRVLLAMARRREMPTALAHVSSDTQSPTRAVWCMGGIVGLLVLVGDVTITWSFSAVTVLVYYGLTHWAALRLPLSARRFPRWVAVAGLVSCLGLAAFVEVEVGLAAVGLLGAGFVVRALVRCRSAG